MIVCRSPQHHSLHLVRLADRTLLIGLSPNGCNLLESAQIALPSPRQAGKLKFMLRTLFLGVLFGTVAFAAPAANSPLSAMGAKGSATTLSLPMQIALSLTLMVLLPAALMSITPFLRITIVLHFLRQALGTQSTPSNQVLIGLSMFLSLLIMQPMATEIYHTAWEPMDQGKLTASQAFDEGSQTSQEVSGQSSPAKKTFNYSSRSRKRPRRAMPLTWGCKC